MAQPPRPFTPRSVAGAVSSIANAAIGKDWPFYAMLLDRWADIVGPDYARTTLPVKISFPKGKPAAQTWLHGKRTDAVLHIQAPKGLILALTYQVETIKQRITACFGYPAVEKIVFDPVYGLKEPPAPPPAPKKLDPAQTAELEDGTKDIENNELREALHLLGESVLNQG